MQDLRFAFRSLAKRPATALLAILTLALGLGSTNVIFSLVRGVLLEPLPLPQPERLVHYWPDRWFTQEEFLFLEEQSLHENESGAFSSLGAYFAWVQMSLTGGEKPEQLQAAEVTPGLFRTLGLQPVLGRDFRAEEIGPGAPKVALLSHGLWQRRFGGEPSVVGRTIQLNGEARQVVGVMPPEARFPRAANELWVPFAFDPADEGGFRARYLQIVGRLAPGVGAERAAAEVTQMGEALRERFRLPEDFAEGAGVVSLKERMVGTSRAHLLLLLGAVVLVLLVAAVNVASLLLARAADRQREVAVRSALGAGRGRLVRLFLLESLLLAAAGGALGLLAAVWGLEGLLAVLDGWVPRLEEISIDGPFLAFSFGLALAVGLSFGLVPALKASRPDLEATLRDGGRSAGRRRTFKGKLLVAAEVALAILLVTGAGLLIKSFWKLTDVEPGFRTEGVLTFLTHPTGIEPGDPEGWRSYFRRVEEELRAIPGVESVGGINMIPILLQGFNGGLRLEGQPDDPNVSLPIVNWRAVTPGYFQTLEIPLRQGRRLQGTDLAGTPQVVLVNETFAERFFPGEDPLGQRIHHSIEKGEWLSVVGVVGDVKQNGQMFDTEPEIYRPVEQAGRSVGLGFMLRTPLEPESLAEQARAAVWSVDPDAPVAMLRSLGSVLHESVALPRLVMGLFAGFAGLALLLGAVGIYGVLSTDVGRRTQEIGVRMAVGAGRSDVVGLVLAQAMAVVVTGAAAGLAVAWGAGRLLESQLFEVAPSDPATFATVAAVLLAVAALAAYLPARRATAVDPVRALREE